MRLCLPLVIKQLFSIHMYISYRNFDVVLYFIAEGISECTHWFSCLVSKVLFLYLIWNTIYRVSKKDEILPWGRKKLVDEYLMNISGRSQNILLPSGWSVKLEIQREDRCSIGLVNTFFTNGAKSSVLFETSVYVYVGGDMSMGTCKRGLFTLLSVGSSWSYKWSKVWF